MSLQQCLLQKEHNGVFFIRKTNNSLFKIKMLLRILYWKKHKYILIVAIHSEVYIFLQSIFHIRKDFLKVDI